MAKYQFLSYTIDYQRVKGCHFVVSECLSARISVRISVMRINILGSCDIEKRINWGLLGRMASGCSCNGRIIYMVRVMDVNVSIV